MKPFRLLEKALDFKANTITITSRSPKKFRNNWVHDMQDYASKIYENIFIANEYKRYKKEDKMKEYQMQAYFYIKIMTQTLEKAEREQCIPLKDEAELGQQLGDIKDMFEGWMSIDRV